jgi:hypothetical protein
MVYEVPVTPNEGHDSRTIQRLVLKNFRRSWYISTEDLLPTKEARRILLPWNICTFRLGNAYICRLKKKAMEEDGSASTVLPATPNQSDSTNDEECAVISNRELAKSVYTAKNLFALNIFADFIDNGGCAEKFALIRAQGKKVASRMQRKSVKQSNGRTTHSGEIVRRKGDVYNVDCAVYNLSNCRIFGWSWWKV